MWGQVFADATKRLVASTRAVWGFLAVSVVAHVLISLITNRPFAMVDLNVYVQGARHLSDHSVYYFVTPDLQLPFTYPPFAAVLFTPLTWLPWTLTRVLWELAMLAASAAILHLTLVLLGLTGRRAATPLPHARNAVVAGTGLLLWFEPVRTTFNYGQINLFLTALMLAGAVSSRSWWAGSTVGLAAGIKLVPAITALYYLAIRRRVAFWWSVLVFALTVGLTWVTLPIQTKRYFTELIFDPGRTGPIGAAINQSLDGASSRFVGHQIATVGWFCCALVVGVLGVWAAVLSARAGDRLAALLAIQFTGLLISPISWSHHWIWIVPFITWGLTGGRARQPAVLALVVCWALAGFSFVNSIAVKVQADAHSFSRPGWQSWLGAVYPLLGVASLAVIAHQAHRQPRDTDPRTPAGAPRAAAGSGSRPGLTSARNSAGHSGVRGRAQ